MSSMKGMIKDAAILFVITLISGLVLGGVNELTKEPIAEQERLAKTEACREVFAAAASFEADETITEEKATASVLAAGYEGVSINEITRAYASDGSCLGYVITVTSHEGYGGDIKFSMGVANDGTLNGISILEISETAGLGMKAEAVLKPQFSDKKVSQFTYTKTGSTSDSEIDAISSATITTAAVTNAVNAGLWYFQNELGGN